MMVQDSMISLRVYSLYVKSNDNALYIIDMYKRPNEAEEDYFHWEMDVYQPLSPR